MQIYRALPQEVLDGLIEYLSHRPHREVEQVMPILRGLEIIKPEAKQNEEVKGEQ